MMITSKQQAYIFILLYILFGPKTPVLNRVTLAVEEMRAIIYIFVNIVNNNTGICVKSINFITNATPRSIGENYIWNQN